MEEDDIAAAMGFSSFGGQKKRKYDQASSPKGPSSSGANSTRLGVRPKLAQQAAGEELDNGVEAQPSVAETADATPTPPTNPKRKPKHQVASSLADFLNRGHALPDKPPVAVQETQPSRPAQPAQPALQQPSPGAGEGASQTMSFGGPSITKSELNALKQGVKNERGDVMFFLPSFVEDPWERLERNRR